MEMANFDPTCRKPPNRCW